MKQTRQMKLFFKSILYSVQLVYNSSKLMILFYLLLNVVDKTIVLVNIDIIRRIIDEISLEQPNISLLILIILLYIGALLLKQAISSANTIIENSISEKAEHRYNVKLLEKLEKLPLSVIDTSFGEDLINDVQFAEHSAVNFTLRMTEIISGFYLFCVAFIALIVFNVWVSLLFLLLSVPGIIIDVIFDRKSEAFRRKTAPDVRKFCYYRWMLTDIWPAKDVRMYDLTKPIKERYDTEKDIYRKANKAIDKKKLSASLFAEVIRRSGEIIFTIFVVIQALDGKITIGDVVLYTGFVFTASGSFQAIMQAIALWYTVFTDRMKRVFEFEKIVCPDDNGGIRTLEKFESLTFDNVYFKYPFTDKLVLQGTSFTLKNGDKLSIVGINGSGKSTIIKLMLGLYQIESGQILINGYPMSDYDINDVRKMFSVLFQSFVQYPLTLRENIALSDIQRQDKDIEIIKALDQSGIYENCDKFEKGLDTYMSRQFDDHGVELSKGQWQKIALSRAYFKNAEIIIFDEPSAALDAEAEDRIFKNFESISDNRTGIMISHRISSARLSNKVIVLDSGKISESGTHEELIALNGLYAKLYRLQMEKYTVKEAKKV